MAVQALGYAGFGSDKIEDWRDFGTGLVGLQAVERGASLLAFRMDDRKQRIVIDRALPEGVRFFGWEVADATALNALAARLERAEVQVTAEPQVLADSRRVRAVISFHDPAGNRLEAFYGAETDNTPFCPGRSISGFRTGPLGLGHAVLTVENIDAMMPFYVDLLGFGLSDYMQRPFRAYFFHINARHHSLALIETGRNGMHHLMVELFSLDDVGQSYDVALSQQDRVNVTLGRHTNDLMTSFYARTPSSFMVECGWGGREIDPSTWRPCELQNGPSLWGHERVWLPPSDREEAREMRMRAAAAGLRAPVQVMAGNYKLLTGTCPWWDSIKQKKLRRPALNFPAHKAAPLHHPGCSSTCRAREIHVWRRKLARSGWPQTHAAWSCPARCREREAAARIRRLSADSPGL
jgi:2,3-dihydroxybiphenyl 1,2-dioxygenase